jgi:SAM-dependent methyltransferase
MRATRDVREGSAFEEPPIKSGSSMAARTDMPSHTIPDFNTVTETPLTRATNDQLQIMYTRYDLASKYSVGKDVLEVACGAGLGLGLLARVARRTVGGDIDKLNCAMAKKTYCGRADVQVKQFDGQKLPFPDASFDVVILYEALYYIRSPDSFFRESRRVLRPGGTLLISSVNCRWAEFNPSPFSVKYFDAAELADSLARCGFQVEMHAGFPESTGGVLRRIIGLARRVAVRLHLIPKTMKGKEWLKHIFYGELKPIPSELSPGIATPALLDKLAAPYSADQYRFIYAIGVLPQPRLITKGV